jgi:catechol 2,3-dioxygenase-like lactoylglutathione lyase family enzyme
MNELSARSLLPFIPGGKDYEASRRLFTDLGFEEVWRNGGYAGFESEHARFILQDFADAAFASNLMIQIVVPDLDRWWEVVSRKRLEETYPGFRVAPPADFPWGREIHFVDLAGVCWHVTAG